MSSHCSPPQANGDGKRPLLVAHTGPRAFVKFLATNWRHLHKTSTLTIAHMSVPYATSFLGASEGAVSKQVSESSALQPQILATGHPSCVIAESPCPPQSGAQHCPEHRQEDMLLHYKVDTEENCRLAVYAGGGLTSRAFAHGLWGPGQITQLLRLRRLVLRKGD